MEILFSFSILMFIIAIIFSLRRLSGREPIDALLYFSGELLKNLNIKKKYSNSSNNSGEMLVLSGLFHNAHYEITLSKENYDKAVSYYLKYTFTSPVNAVKTE